jgi:hypothetical protein
MRRYGRDSVGDSVGKVFSRSRFIRPGGVVTSLPVLSVEPPFGDTMLVHLDPRARQRRSSPLLQLCIRSSEFVFTRHGLHDLTESSVFIQVKFLYQGLMA